MREIILGASPVKTLLSNGETTAYHGLRLPVLVAGDCSAINDGSGVGHLRHGVQFTTRRELNLTTKVNCAGLTEEQAMAAVKASVTLTPRSVLPGGHALEVDGVGRCKNKSVARWSVDTAATTMVWSRKEDVVNVAVPATESMTSPVAKVAKAGGVKAVLRQSPRLWVFDAAGDPCGDWAAVLPPESLKGVRALYLEMACHAYNVECVMKPGRWTPEAEALVQRLLADPAHVRTVQVVYHMEAGEYLRAYAEHRKNPAYMWDVDANGVNVMTWTGQVVYGDIVVAVENTPIYLSMGSSTLTPEMTVDMAMVHAPLVQYFTGDLDFGPYIEDPMLFWLDQMDIGLDIIGLIDGGRSSIRVGEAYRARCKSMQRVVSLANAKDKDIPAEIPRMALGEYISGAKVVGLKDLRTTDKVLVKRLAKAYPQGLVFTYPHEEPLFLDFTVLSAMGPRDEGGKGYSYVAAVCDFFRFLARVGQFEGVKERQVEKFMRLTKKHLVSAVADAPKTLGGVLRPVPAFTRTVTTSSSVDVQPWVMCVPASDPLVLSGELRSGDVVIKERTPVFFGAVFTVEVVDWLPVGLVAINPLCWHADTEGDADGDKEFDVIVPPFLAASTVVAYKNAGWLGPDAYFRLRGHEVLV